MHLTLGMEPSVFLKTIWQRKPLLIRRAVDPSLLKVSPDELAGLACEDEIESRLVVQHSDSDWHVEHGPFDVARFADLPDQDWTLLVQDVDKYVPSVYRLLDLFDFLPACRVEDIMISYAADGGGVGPHTDAYDVFLLQAAGQRRWRLSNRAYTDQDLLPDLDLRILAEFEVDDDWVLNPGDALYLPPGLAHWGTAVGECTTYSLGFRAPDQGELATEWYQHTVSKASNEVLQIPISGDQAASSGLNDAAFDRARRLVDTLPGTDSSEFKTWLGCLLTEPKPQFQIEPPAERLAPDGLREMLRTGQHVMRHPWARVTWMKDVDGNIQLFANGEVYLRTGISCAAADCICNRRRLNLEMFSANERNEVTGLLARLVDDGILELNQGE